MAIVAVASSSLAELMALAVVVVVLIVELVANDDVIVVDIFSMARNGSGSLFCGVDGVTTFGSSAIAIRRYFD